MTPSGRPRSRIAVLTQRSWGGQVDADEVDVHFVEGVGNGDSQVYQNDQGVENVIAAADEIVGCADINDGADPPPQGLYRSGSCHGGLLFNSVWACCSVGANFFTL